MLSDTELTVARALREFVGPDRVGTGPDVPQLMSRLPDLEPVAICNALIQLEFLAFITVSRGLPTTANGGVPEELRDIVGITVRERLQEYLD